MLRVADAFGGDLDAVPPHEPGPERYVAKFHELADWVVDYDAQDRFLDTVKRLPELTAAEVAGLCLPGIAQAGEKPVTKGIF